LDRSFAVPFVHRLRFSEGVFGAGNEVLDGLLAPEDGRPARVLVAVDDGLLRAMPALKEQIEAFLSSRRGRIESAGPVIAVPGGETCKNDRTVLDTLLAAMHRARLCRRSYVLVVGGGAVLDVVGYAASIFHRGVRLVRVPSTTLAQADSGVGVKSAVNLFETKNLVGAFCPPWAVVNDERLLSTLSDDHWRDGFSEAVKVALLKDPELYALIRTSAPRLRARDMQAAIPIIRRSAILHLEHITGGGDPFEFRHARPLDFGHWAAHKLEQMTGFELSHGHAVAVGVGLDTMYAELSGLADAGLGAQVATCLQEIGLPVWHPVLAQTDRLLDGLQEFREHLGGVLTVTLIRRPGVPLDVHEIDPATVRRSVTRLQELSEGGAHADGPPTKRAVAAAAKTSRCVS
jgi:3-dehydroquinate synthase